MPYKLRKAPNRNLYWVVAEDGSKKSKEPIPLERAKAQMKALYISLKGGFGFGKRKCKKCGKLKGNGQIFSNIVGINLTEQQIEQFTQELTAIFFEALRAGNRIEPEEQDQYLFQILQRHGINPNLLHYEIINDIIKESIRRVRAQLALNQAEVARQEAEAQAARDEQKRIKKEKKQLTKEQQRSNKSQPAFKHSNKGRM